MSNQDGIVGFAVQGDSNSSLFIQEAFKQGLIRRRMFSLYIGSYNTPSKLHLGGYDENYFGGNKNALQWMPLVDPYFWKVCLNSVTVGSTPITLGWNMRVIFDSGTSLMTYPTIIYNSVVNAINNNVTINPLYQGC